MISPHNIAVNVPSAPLSDPLRMEFVVSKADMMINESREHDNIPIEKRKQPPGHEASGPKKVPTLDEKCPSCDQQLYSVETRRSGFLGWSKSTERIPLTIPYLVQDGHCLVCSESNCRDLCLEAVPEESTPLSKLELEYITATAQSLQPGTLNFKGQYNAYGEKHGKGEIIWSNGNVFRGHFVDDLREGRGELISAIKEQEKQVKDEYIGEWHLGKMHGKGTRRYPNGDLYVGEFKDSKRDGKGRFEHFNGDVYWGDWKKNNMHGHNRYQLASGYRFEGQFVQGKRFGVGKTQYIDGSVEIFQYVNNEAVGQGVCWSSDRSKAWRLWIPDDQRRRNSPTSSIQTKKYEMKRITTAEAVSILQEIERAAMECLP